MIKNIDISHLPRTEEENMIYMPQGYAESVELVFKRLGLNVEEHSQRVPICKETRMTIEDRINWYMYFIKNTHERVVKVEEGRVCQDKKYYYKNKNTGNLEYGTLEDFREKATDPSRESHNAVFYTVDEITGRKERYPLNHIGVGPAGRNVYFKYEVEPFVQLCLEILNDRDALDEMYKAEKEETRKEWEEYRKEHPAIIVKDPFGEECVIN